MATSEKYTTVIELNSEQAKRELDELRRKVDSWKSDLAEARKNKMGRGFIAEIQKELRAAEKELGKYDNEVAQTINTLQNIGEASVESIEKAQQSLRRMASENPADSGFYKSLNSQLEQVTRELENIKATKAFEQMQREADGTVKSTKLVADELAYAKLIAENLEQATVKEMELAAKTAENIKKTTVQGSAEWNDADASLTKIHGRLQEIEREQQKVNHAIDYYDEEIRKASKDIETVQRETKLVDATLNNLSSAKVRDIEYSIKILNEQLRDIERTGGNVEELTEKLKKLTTELKKVQDMQKPDEQKDNIFSRMITGLNKNWGAITQIMGAVTGLTMTVRKSVQDFATMEEEMANVRKYTGLTTEKISSLNEELKKMDTRTSREELNQLAGSAGRLGITSQESVLEFVDAADKIKVALGDDLGEGAVDQIGKLAMAFGEDERMGLRGAMLATGSAVNELAQNSSAQAGFLVDFTARVAGFGKQLGLMQADIMGFGAVMDENLLRDEMAATAFGNMLTKMQTDTEKFARIAGQDVKEFTKLLNEDANQAILNLADSLRSQDPQTMMKMLDDMGLDGARAVGVLSTMADKIDDVRERQRIANQAYKEGSSVINEFGVMNNTVQARLEKCKKQFHEMTVELGEQLLPIVRYTCTGFSLFVKILSTATKFATEHKTEIASVGLAIAAYTAYIKKATIATKLHTVATNVAKAATAAFNFVTKMNPIGLLVAALTAAVALFIKYRDRINGASEATSMLRQAGAKLAGVLAQVAGWMVSLVKWAVSLYDKFALIRKVIQLLVTAFTAGFSTITIAVKLLIDELEGVATVIEGIFTLDWDKIKEGYKQGFKAVADAAVAQFNNVKRTVKDVFSGAPPAGGGQNSVAAGAAVGAAAASAIGQSATKEETLPEVVVTPQKKGAYESEAERKQREKEERKAERERKAREKEQLRDLREQNKQLKAETDKRLADEQMNYSLGLTNYLAYIEKRKQIQLDGIKQRKALFQQGSAEYLRLDAEEKRLLAHGDEEQRKLKLQEYERMHQDLMMKLERDFNTEGSAIYQNEAALNEALFQGEMDFLENKKSLTVKGSLEEMQIEWEMQDLSKQHQLEREQYFQEQLENVRKGYLGQADERAMTLALNNLDELHRRKLLSEREYQEAKLAIEAQYANYETKSEKDQRVGNNALRVAQNTARQKIDEHNPNTLSTPFIGDIQMYQSTMEQLKQMYQSDQMTHAQYLAAKQQATQQFCESMAQQMQAAYNTVNQVMSAASSYFSAQQEYETAQVKRKYEKQIEAAGNNQKKVKKLQEKQQKEEAAIKSKYAKRAAAIQMAQAVAQTAISAINAYSSAAAIPVVGHVLAPIAAAMAIAAGMLQIATIKKQQQAQEAGYYEGGFTGGRQYRREAGVVHEGEFVANHQAVGNPAILPVLNFLDQAQRNNTVGSLTAADVSRSMGAGGSAQVIAPVVNVHTDNEELRGELSRVGDINDLLLQQLQEPINAQVVLTGPNGLIAQQKRYDQMTKNK